jgi:hypothetical protein
MVQLRVPAQRMTKRVSCHAEHTVSFFSNLCRLRPVSCDVHDYVKTGSFKNILLFTILLFIFYIDTSYTVLLRCRGLLFKWVQ